MCLPLLEPCRAGEHVVEATIGCSNLFDEVDVGGQLDPAGRIGPSDQVGRMLTRAPPGLIVVSSVDAVEHCGEFAIPRPVQVGGQAG